jgi:preprotein translocase subunit SecD
MKRSTIWVVVGGAILAVLAVAMLPLLGLAIFFRNDIRDWLVGESVDRSRGTLLVYEMQPEAPAASLPDAEEVRRRILRRIDPEGRRGCEVVVRGREVEVRVPGDVARADSVKRLLSRTGHLEFRIAADRVKDRDLADFDRLVRLKKEGLPPDDPRFRWCLVKRGWEWYKSPRGSLLDAWNFVYVVDEAKREIEALVNVADGQDVTGMDLASAHALSLSDREPVVSFTMKAESENRFARLTAPENRGRQMAVILDGVIQSAPCLMATLSTSGIIEGYVDRQELEDVVTILNTGELGCRLGDPVREESFGPGGP